MVYIEGVAPGVVGESVIFVRKTDAGNLLGVHLIC